MAQNELTAVQDVKTREFLIEVALAENVLDNNPAMKSALVRACYILLNYQRLNDGRFVSRDKNIRYKLGGTVSHDEFPDEWSDDYARALKELGASNDQVQVINPVQETKVTDYDSGSDQADSGKQAENPSLWKTLFPKDV